MVLGTLELLVVIPFFLSSRISLRVDFSTFEKLAGSLAA